MTGVETGSTRRVLRRGLAPYVYLFLIGFTAAFVHIIQYTTFSPIDELRHVDYAMRASRLDVPRYGDLLVEESMREEACHGLDLGGWVDPPCSAKTLDPVGFRDDGYQIASIHPPPYYVASGVFARVAKGTGLTDSFVNPARVFSALLLGIGLMVAFAAGKLLGARTAPLLAALTFLPVMSAVLHSASTVNPDSTSILVGSLVLLVALLWERGRVPTWVLPLLGAFATGIKYTSALAVGIVAMLFIVRAEPVELWRRSRARTRVRPSGAEVPAGPSIDPPTDPPTDESVELPTEPRFERVRTPRQYLLAVLLLVGSALVVVVAWSAIDQMRAVVDPLQVPQVRLTQSDGFPPLDFFFRAQQMFAWLPPAGGYEPAMLITDFTESARLLITFVFAGAVLMATLRLDRRDDMSVVGACCVGVALIGGPAYVAVNVLAQGILLDLPGRYGMSVLPFMAPVVASFAVNRVGTGLLWATALVSYALVVGAMIVA